MLKNHLKLVLRKLRKERIYTFVNITGLTIGLTAFLLIALYVRDELSFDQFHTNKDNIYRVTSVHKEWGERHLIATDFAKFFKPEVAQIDAYLRLSRAGLPTLLDHDGKRLNASGVFYTDSNFFDFFSFELLNSTTQDVLEESGRAVVSESFGLKMFGNDDPVGKLLKVNKGEEYMISAVAKDPPKNSTIQFDVLLRKNDVFKNNFEKTHGIRNVLTYISILPGSTPVEIAKGINEARDKPPYRRFMESQEYKLLALTDQRLNAPYNADIFPKNDSRYVLLFSGIGLVILVLAFINYINLVTAQSLKRAKEIGLRKVIGAERQQLISYQVTESIVVTMISFLFAFAIAERVIPVFNQLLDKEITLRYFSADFFIWVLLVGIVLGLVAGGYPAFMAARTKPLTLLQHGGTSSGSKGWLRKGLVLVQFVASAILLTVLVIMTSQMNFLQEKELGYNSDFLVTVPLDSDSTHLFQKVKSEVLGVKGVKFASLGGFKVGGSVITSVMDGPNKQGEGAEGSAMDVVFADDDFLETMDLDMYWVSDRMKEGKFEGRQMMINQTLARKMGWLEDPSGKRLYGWNDDVGNEIVGIVNDFHFKSLKDEIEPLVIQPLGSWGTDNVLVKLEASSASESLGQIGETYERLFERPFEYYYMDDEIANFYRKEQGQFKLFQIFSFLAVFVSLLGLIALTIYMVEQRRKEVSIRKVLGASIKQLILMLNREYTMLVIIAFLIASPIAYYSMQDWLSAFKYRISIHPLLFIGAFMAFMTLSWLVTILQSFRVSRENPADVLRDE